MSRACPTEQVHTCDLVNASGEEKNEIYREGTGDGVEAYMYLVNKVGGITDAH